MVQLVVVTAIDVPVPDTLQPAQADAAPLAQQHLVGQRRLAVHEAADDGTVADPLHRSLEPGGPYVLAAPWPAQVSLHPAAADDVVRRGLRAVDLRVPVDVEGDVVRLRPRLRHAARTPLPSQEDVPGDQRVDVLVGVHVVAVNGLLGPPQPVAVLEATQPRLMSRRPAKGGHRARGSGRHRTSRQGLGTARRLTCRP